MEKATFAAGCFWGVEAAYRQLDGVTGTRVGYIGGQTDSPTYEEVCSGRTGHAEAVEVTYDPERVSYEELLEVFWSNHNPTTRDRQGFDIGSQYRSAVFTHSPEQAEAVGRGDRAPGRGGAVAEPDRDPGRRGARVLRGRGLPPAVPGEAGPLLLHGRARRPAVRLS